MRNFLFMPETWILDSDMYFIQTWDSKSYQSSEKIFVLSVINAYISQHEKISEELELTNRL